MKNLPEDDLFEALGDRLRNYQEQPDDDTWKKISTRIPGLEPTWIKWTDRAALLLAFLILGFIATESGLNVAHNPEGVQLAAKSERPETDESIINNDTIDSASGKSNVIIRHSDEGLREKKSMVDRPETRNLSIMKRRSATDHFPRDSGSTSGLTAGHSSLNTRDHNELTVLEKPITSEKNRGDDPSDLKVDWKDNVEDNNFPVYDTTMNKLTPPHLQQEPATRVQGDSGVVTQSQVIAVAADSLSSQPSAKTSETTTSAKKKTGVPIRVYAIITPMLAFQHLTPNSNDNVVIQRLNSPPLLSQKRFSFGLDAGVQAPLTRHVSYIAGFSYYHQSAVISYNQFSASSAQVEEEQGDGYTIIPGSETHTVPYKLNNVGISAGLLYTLDVNKLIHSGGALLQYEAGFQGASNRETGASNMRSFLNFRIIYRAEYTFSNRTSVFIQPSFSRSLLNDRPVDLPFSVKQSRVGIGVGLLYRF